MKSPGSNKFALILIILFLMFLSLKGWAQGPEINLEYMDSRMEQFQLPRGKSITIWKTANPDLKSRGIVASTGETALVTRAYLLHYHLFQSSESFDKALKGLEFLYYMQDESGCFYPHLKGDIQGDPRTGTPDLTEPTAQAFITLSVGIDTFKGGYTSDFSALEKSFTKVTDSLNRWMEDPLHLYGDYKTFEEMQIPSWLIEGRGDLSAMYLYGLARSARRLPYGSIQQTAEKLADGITRFRFSGADDFPRDALLSFSDNPGIWRTENALGGAALALAGKNFDRGSWLAEGRREIIGHLMHLPASYGPIDGYYPHPDISPQTPLGAYTLTKNFATLAQADNRESLFKVAGIIGAWFFRGNPSGHPVYSSDDGSCFAGVKENQLKMSKCLTGSACANLTLMELHRTSGFDYLDYREDQVHAFLVLESEEGQPVNTDFEVAPRQYTHGKSGKVVIIRQRNTFWHKFNVDYDDDYYLLMSFQRQPFYSSAVAVNVRVDGGPILLIPLGGATGEPYLTMQRVMEPVQLMKGLHTVGVRYRGLLLTQPAIIDCIVIQPVLERRWFSNSTGKKLLLINNREKTPKKLLIPENIDPGTSLIKAVGLDGKVTEKPVIEKNDNHYMKIPPGGFGIIEW